MKETVQKMSMSRLLLYSLISLYTLFYFGLKPHKTKHTFKTHDLLNST